MDRNLVFRVLAVIILYAVSNSNAVAATISEYDNATQDHRNAFVANSLQRISKYYNSNTETRENAICMEQLYATKNASGDPLLFTLIVNEIDSAREIDPDGFAVEEIIYGVIESECKPKTDATSGQQ